MNNSSAGLRVENVHLWRGDRHVLRGVDLEAAPGDLLQVSGANGAGKTTLLRVIAGLLRPEEGRVLWNGAAVAHTRTVFQEALAYASHEPALKNDLTALENLRFMVGLKRRITDAEIRRGLARTGVAEQAELPIRILSAGQRRRVALARVWVSGAALWLLDEPYTNLDTAGSRVLSALLADHVRAGGMALVAAHHAIGIDGTKHFELRA